MQRSHSFAGDLVLRGSGQRQVQYLVADLARHSAAQPSSGRASWTQGKAQRVARRASQIAVVLRLRICFEARSGPTHFAPVVTVFGQSCNNMSCDNRFPCAGACGFLGGWLPRCDREAAF